MGGGFLNLGLYWWMGGCMVGTIFAVGIWFTLGSARGSDGQVCQAVMSVIMLNVIIFIVMAVAFPIAIGTGQFRDSLGFDLGP